MPVNKGCTRDDVCDRSEASRDEAAIMMLLVVQTETTPHRRQQTVLSDAWNLNAERCVEARKREEAMEGRLLQNMKEK